LQRFGRPEKDGTVRNHLQQKDPGSRFIIKKRKKTLPPRRTRVREAAAGRSKVIKVGLERDRKSEKEGKAGGGGGPGDL